MMHWPSVSVAALAEAHPRSPSWTVDMAFAQVQMEGIDAWRQPVADVRFVGEQTELVGVGQALLDTLRPCGQGFHTACSSRASMRSFSARSVPMPITVTLERIRTGEPSPVPSLRW